MRAVIFYLMTAILFVCVYFETFWFDNVFGELLDWIGIHLHPIPKPVQVIFAIIFATFVIAYFGFMLSFQLEAIERHADDDNYFKMKRSWVSRLIEGNKPVHSTWKPDRTVLPVDDVKTLYDRPGKEDIFDDNLQLKTSMAAFVRFTVDNKVFDTFNIDTWRKIDGIFRNKKGDRITADQLAQCNSDIQQRQRV